MTDPTLTDDDARATIGADFDSTLFVKAGAGSGKTHALVQRIRGLVCAAGVEIPRIAAITFTEKAAAELRDRIRSELEAARRDDDPTVADRAARAIDDIDSAAIGTLHSFAQRLLSERAIEAGLPPRIEILDEVGSDVNFAERWGVFIDALLEHPDGARPFRVCSTKRIGPDDLRAHGPEAGGQLGPARDCARSGTPGPPRPARPGGVGRRDPLDDPGRRGHGLHPDPGGPHQQQRGEAHRRVARLRRACPIGPRRRRGARRVRRGAEREGRRAERGTRCAAHHGREREGAGHRGAARLRPMVRMAHRPLRASTAPRSGAPRARSSSTTCWCSPAGCCATRSTAGGPVQPRSAIPPAAARRVPGHRPDPDRDRGAARRGRPARHRSLHPTWHEIAVEAGRLFFVGDPKQSIYRFRRADISLFLAAEDRVRAGKSRSHRTSARSAVIRVRQRRLRWADRREARCTGRLRAARRDPDDAVDRPAGQHARRDPAHPERGTERRGVRHRRRDRPDGRRRLDGDRHRRRRSANDPPGRAGRRRILLPGRTSLNLLLGALEDAGIPYRTESSRSCTAAEEIREIMARCGPSTTPPTNSQPSPPCARHCSAVVTTTSSTGSCARRVTGTFAAP